MAASDTGGQIVAVIQQSGPGWSFYAILISAFLAAIIAIVSMAAQRTISKRRAAVDLILISETDVFKANRAELEDALATGKLLDILKPASAKDFERRRCISNVLNHYELTAVAIFNRTVDEQIVKQYQYSQVVHTWNACKGLVDRINGSERATAYENFRKLAERWTAHPERVNSPGRRIGNAFRELIPW